MGKTYETIYQLVDRWFDIEEEIEIEESKEKLEALKQIQAELYNAFIKKADRLDIVTLLTKKKIAKLEAEKRVVKTEFDRLSAKIKQHQKFITMLNEKLIPTIISIIGKNGILETGISKFRLVKKWNIKKLNIKEIPETYIIKYIPKYDKRTLRKDAIAAAKKGQSISGIEMEISDSTRRY